MGTLLQRRDSLRALAALATIALLVFSVPHSHAQARVSDLHQSCRICKARDAVSATPPPPAVTGICPAPVPATVHPGPPEPRASAHVASASPRAPPSLS